MKTILAIFIFITLITSCEKRNTVDAILSIENETNITEKVIQFRNKMNKKSESIENIVFNEAILLMEGTFNYYYGFPNENYSKVETDTIVLPINYDQNELVAMNELQAIYIELNNSIYESYMNCEFQDKHIIYTNLEIQTDGENKIFVFVFIGQLSSNIAKSMNKNDAVWLNATPFNDQQDQFWYVYDHNPSNIFSPEIIFDDDISLALNSILSVPPIGEYTWIYNVSSTNWLTEPIPNINTIYIPNYDVAAPNINLNCYEMGTEQFFNLHACWAYNSGNGWNWCCNDNYTTPSVDYKLMNKYYNICMAAIPINKPTNKKAIDIIFATHKFDYHNEGQAARMLYGTVKITYAVVYKEPEQLPCTDPFRL